ncbi:MAG: bifunctional nuclease family protein [Acidimicrobiales bacterium]|jgi:bifunctional DNase/RNase
MGTDENAVRADAESEAVTRGNGDGAAFGGGGALSAQMALSSDGPETDVPAEAELIAGAPDEVAIETAEAPVGPGEPGVFEEPAGDGSTTPDEPAADADQELAAGAPAAMSQMIFVDVVLVLPATHPVVVLQEADAPFRELRIPVGGAEGIAISYAGRGLETPRPLTHELFARVLEEFGMILDVVRITEVRGTAFTAEMVLSGQLGTRVIDCRPSDAIALALRHRLPVPIMVDPNVLEVAGTDPMGAN